MNSFDVAIVGGGISGIHAAIELSDLGYSVVILEKKAFIGGKASQLGKFFPTDDCALCLSISDSLFKKGSFRRCLYRSNLADNPNITILPLSEVTGITKTENLFALKINKIPRYISERCIDCKACEAVCPISVKNEFNYGVDTRKCIYLPFPQAIPHRYVIDRENCVGCKKHECVDACPVKAINLAEKAETIEIKAKSVLLSLGFEEVGKSELHPIGLDNGYKNVITQIQLARLLDPTGPTKGEILNLETGQKAKSVTIGLCSGSRDSRFKEYCSKICCTYSLKHALMLMEKGIGVKICYMDIRTIGEYEDYYLRARTKGVSFIRGRISNIEQDPISKKVIVQVENTLNSELLEWEEDLVVLTPPIIPAKDAKKLAQLCNLDTDENGFFMGNKEKISSVETKNQGIFIAGTIEGPKDIPDTIAQSDAATIKIHNFLKGGK